MSNVFDWCPRFYSCLQRPLRETETVRVVYVFWMLILERSEASPPSQLQKQSALVSAGKDELKKEENPMLWMSSHRHGRYVQRKKSYNSHIRIQRLFLSHTPRQKHTHSVLFLTWKRQRVLGFIPLENLKSKRQTPVTHQLFIAQLFLRVCDQIWVACPCISDAYLPGCVLCGISASALSTGRTASWTCCCSRRRVSAPSRRTASAPCAGWSWSPRWTWSRRSPTSGALHGGK